MASSPHISSVSLEKLNSINVKSFVSVKAFVYCTTARPSQVKSEEVGIGGGGARWDKKVVFGNCVFI